MLYREERTGDREHIQVFHQYNGTPEEEAESLELVATSHIIQLIDNVFSVQESLLHHGDSYLLHYQLRKDGAYRRYKYLTSFSMISRNVSIATSLSLCCCENVVWTPPKNSDSSMMSLTVSIATSLS